MRYPKACPPKKISTQQDTIVFSNKQIHRKIVYCNIQFLAEIVLCNIQSVQTMRPRCRRGRGRPRPRAVWYKLNGFTVFVGTTRLASLSALQNYGYVSLCLLLALGCYFEDYYYFFIVPLLFDAVALSKMDRNLHIHGKSSIFAGLMCAVGKRRGHRQ